MVTWLEQQSKRAVWAVMLFISASNVPAAEINVIWSLQE